MPGGMLPIVPPPAQQPAKKPKIYNPKLASGNPEMYAAIEAGNPSPEDRLFLENVQYLAAKHQELISIKDLSKARTNFQALDKDLQDSLKWLNKDAEYQQSNAQAAITIGDAVRSTFLAPLRTVWNAAVDVTEGLARTGYANLEATSNVLEPGGLKKAFERFTSTKKFTDTWAGRDLWREEDKIKLNEVHGRGMAALVRGQLDGKTPGAIYSENPDLTYEIGMAIQGMAEYNAYIMYKEQGKADGHPLSPQGELYQIAVTEAQNKRATFGNDITNYINSAHPPKDAGLLAQTLIVGFLETINFGGVVGQSPSGSEWQVQNKLPWKANEMLPPRTMLDTEYMILGDPTTWLTFGGSKASTLAGKLAEDFIAKGKAGVANDIRIADLFANKNFYKTHENLVGLINDLRLARETGDKKFAAATTLRLGRDHPGYYSAPTIELLVNGKFADAVGNSIKVTDMKSLETFFNRGDMINYITTGKTHNIGHYRDTAIALERSHRLGTNLIRRTYEKVFNGIDDTAPNGIMKDTKLDERLKNAEKALSSIHGKPNYVYDPEIKEVLKLLTDNGNKIQRNYSKIMAIHPEDVMIHTSDELVHKSLDAFTDFARVLTGDKATAHLIKEIYLAKEPAERFDMLFSMYKYYTDKIGMSSLPAGLEKQNIFLEEVFGMSGFGLKNIVTPPHLVKPGVVKLPGGTSQPLHLTKGISMLNFTRVHQELYESRNFLSKERIMGSLSYSIPARIVNDAWVLLQLFPKIGIKGAVDEIITTSLTTGYENIFAFLGGTGRNASAAKAAYLASDESLGLVKTKMRGRTSPDKYIPLDVRKQILDETRIDQSMGTFEERIADIAIAKYAGKLSPEMKQYLKDELIYNSHSMHAEVNSNIAAAYGNTAMKGGMFEAIYGKGPFAQFLDDKHLKQTGTHVSVEMKKLSKRSQTYVHYDYFFRNFAKNVWSHKPSGTSVNLGNVFVKHNAIRTTADGEKYVAEVMSKIGYTKDSNGLWIPEVRKIGVDKTGADIFSDSLTKKSIKQFNTDFRQSTGLSAAGLSPGEISEAIVRNSLDELYTIFHGAPDVFNDNLLNMVRFKQKEQYDKLVKQAAWRARNNVVLTPSEAEALAKWENKSTSASYIIEKTEFKDFEQATDNFGLTTESLKTELNLPEIPTEFLAAWNKFKGSLWEVMERQNNDLFRSDAYMVKVFEERAKLKPAYKQYINDLININKKKHPSQQASVHDIIIQADAVFSAQASQNAVGTIVNYVDNPAIRSQLAWTLRGIGRFNRANEDFYRRMYRFLTKNPGRVLWRAGHLGQAMDNNGFIHKDENGNQYVILPNDGILWRTVNPVLTAILNPISAAQAIKNGETESFFKQPKYNAYTMNLSMLNPSYSDTAGAASLQGPSMALSVFAAKQAFGFIGLDSIAEELDNLILGPISDNSTLLRGLFPSVITNAMKVQETSMEEGGGAASFTVDLMRAASFLQFNEETRMEPGDYENAEKSQKFFDRLGIAAANIISIKAFFNMFSPMPIGTTTDGMNPLLRDAGITTPTAEFSDILRAVLQTNAESGYQIQEPIATATALFVGKYPDRLVFTVSRDSKAAKLYINSTKETKKWVLNNPDLIKAYGDVAFAFAPNRGIYDPSVVKYLQASGILEKGNDPFVDTDGSQTSPLYRYIKTLAAVKDRAKYYDIDREYNALVTDPNEPQRNDPTFRATMRAQADAKKAKLKESNPMLKYILATSEYTVREDMRNRYEKLKQLVWDKRFTSEKGGRNKLPAGQQQALQLMTNIATNMLIAFEDPTIRQQFQGQATLDKVYREGVNNLRKASAASDGSSDALQDIIMPLLDSVYKLPTKGLINNG